MDSNPKSISRAHSLVGFKPEGRPKADFYPTPPEATRALLRMERFGRVIWEPAAGNMAISDVLIDHGYAPFSSDIVYYGKPLDACPMDFLTCRKCPDGTEAIITNPPFSLFNEFLQKCLDLRVPKFALLGKLAALETQDRVDILKKSPLKRAYIFRKRIQMTRNGEPMKNKGMLAFCWLVWDWEYKGPPIIEWI